ncbi:hypothetical protein AGMMS49938_06850 [Fibrobacterales bacterium]|nr:hypothetical protein AGMMS49938_06850 [Fibrobacterales bacterium]
MKIEKFDSGILQKISKIIGKMFTGSEIPKILKEANINNISQHSTKWRIIEECLIEKQSQDNCANNILNFVKIALSPTHNIDNLNYDNNILEINEILSFKGLEIKSGSFSF